MILISIELPTTWNPRSKEKKQENYETMKIFELLWKRCFLYTANNGINDFLTKKKRRLEWKNKLFYPGAWCSRFKRKICSNENKNIYTAVWNLFFLPINYLASYLYNFICLIMKNPSDCWPATLLLLLLYYKYNSKVNVACSKKIEKNFRLLIPKIFHCEYCVNFVRRILKA